MCQKFFLSTLSISEMFMRGCFKNLSETNVVESDAREVFGPHNKTPESARQYVKDHINYFPRMPAHYVRKDTKTEYLEQDLNVTKMYELYVDKCKEDEVEPVKINMYRNILKKDFNIGFHKPRKDMCDECFAYDNMNDEEKEAKKGEHEAHLQRKLQARRHRDEAKELALDDEIHFAEYDMEAICHIPTTSSKKIFYKRRLLVYNCTLLDFGKEKREVTCYCWNEGVGNKGANEVGSSLLKYMTEKADGKPIMFMSDTCASQCRNMYISALMLYCVAVLDIPEINQKYFESGHSQISDNIHATIELAKKNVPIFDPSSYYTIIRTASRRNPYKVKEMGQEDFYDLKKLKTVMIKNCKTDTDEETVNWLKIKWLQYRKNDPEHIYFKYDLDSESFKKIKVFRRGKRATSSRIILQKAYSGPIAISADKYNDLQELCRSGVVPSTYHDFYNHLQVDHE